MNIRDSIFEMEHSNIGRILTPVKDLNNKEIEQVISDFGLDINKFFKVSGALHPYAYVDGTVYVEAYQLSKLEFEQLLLAERIKQLTKFHKECIANNNYVDLFKLMDKPFRIKYYKKLFDNIPDVQKYEVFKFIYTHSEYGFEDLPRKFMERIFSYKSKDEKLDLDDVVEIYRGEASMSRHYDEAYSWTTDLEVAEFFASRFSSNGEVYRGYVSKENILDYIEDRGEYEVVVFPENVFDVETM